MKTNEFIRKYAEKYNTTIKFATFVYDTFIKHLKETLQEGEDVYLHTFGVFKHHTIPERNVRHPSTGEMMVAPAKTLIKFKESESTNQ